MTDNNHRISHGIGWYVKTILTGRGGEGGRLPVSNRVDGEDLPDVEIEDVEATRRRPAIEMEATNSRVR